MGVEGHPWDTALFTGAVAHVESYQRDVAVLDSAYTSFQRPKLPMPQGWLALCTFLASTSVFVWLQLANIALRPLSAKLVPSHAWCHQRSKGPWHPPLPNPRNFGQHRCWITGATTRHPQTGRVTSSHGHTLGESPSLCSPSAYLLLGPAGLLEHHPGDVGSLRVGHGVGGQVALVLEARLALI